METIQAKYIEWLSAEEMHKGSQLWLSELEFIKDEHLFFEHLIKSHTLQLIDPEKFSHNTQVIDAVNTSQRQTIQLIDLVKQHENALGIMVDDVDQPNEEEVYKKEHRTLINKINEFKKHYQCLKKQLFGIVKDIKKQEKQRRLLDTKTPF
ncbi:MAG: hypothetical protein ED556_00770 [Winogradskyella sp.]|uniref:hypothetical protein n=1 Tax=Winogradskyella sp. TaxID=1883156 RepID=UPI000F3FA84D|nr:hypothetical protein [Winogradskyella sp.]RNC87754.1 MAG: hypothetical protein ED556_00770 [Winogradskyella sp.]